MSTWRADVAESFSQVGIQYDLIAEADAQILCYLLRYLHIAVS